MSSNTLETVDTDTTTETSQVKTYTQEEFDRHMAGLKTSITKKFEKQFEGVDVNEYHSLKTAAEKHQTELAMRRGDFEKVLQEKISIKDAEIAKRDDIIRQFKIDMPLLAAASRFKAVNPEQVKSLIRDKIRLAEDGDVEVLGDDGQVRYDDSGKPVNVDSFVQEWLQKNPHFSQATPATTNTQSNLGIKATTGAIDISKLDLTKIEDRKIYAEARRKGLV